MTETVQRRHFKYLSLFTSIQNLFQRGVFPSRRVDEEEAFVEEVVKHVVPAKDYRVVRKYPVIGEQLDILWHDINNGVLGDSAKESEWYKSIKEIKNNHPKPNN